MGKRSIHQALILCALVTGCASGPDFQRPPPPTVSGYTGDPVPSETVSAASLSGETQRFTADGTVGAQWWRELGSSKLDTLVEAALQGSPTIAAAQATLRQWQELYAAQAGAKLYPQADLGIGGQRQRLSPSALGQPGEPREFDLYDAGIGVRYQLDLSGGNRRSLEALAARTDYRRYELEGARLTLSANVVACAITRARLAGQIEATKAILLSLDQQVAVARDRLRLGHASPNDVLALQAQADQTRAELPRLRKQLQQNEHLLAVLMGRAPGAGSLPALALEEFTLPSDLPLVLPSALVRRRPDIQGAESLLRAANAEYGVAVAKMYPQLTISASLGSQALSAAALFGGGAAVWSLAGQLTQPLFNPGLPAEKRASLAAFEAAAANYQSIVLESLRDVADVLRALENDAQTLAALASADAAARQSLESIRSQYALGAASYVQVLAAEEQAQQTRLGLIAARAQRLLSSVALFQAIGGGGSTASPISQQ